MPGYGSKASRKANTKFYSTIFCSTSPEDHKENSNSANGKLITERHKLPGRTSNTISLPLRSDAVSNTKEPSRTVRIASTLAYRPKPVLSNICKSQVQTQKLRAIKEPVIQPSKQSSFQQKSYHKSINELSVDHGILPIRSKLKRTKKLSECKQSVESSKSTSIKVPPQSLAEQTRYVSPVFELIEHDENRCIKSYADFSTFVFDNGTASKIAEAGFGEVYQISIPDSDDKTAPPEESVFKILPLRRQTVDARTRSKWTKEQRDRYERELTEHTALKDALSEIKILIKLSPIVGFVDFKEIHVLRGRANNYWSSIWQDFEAKQTERSVFPDPSDPEGWADDQLFLAIEMVYAGQPLSKLLPQVNTVWTVWDIIWGVIIAIGRAEELNKFEHRDLHVGNICIKSGENSDAQLDQLPVPDYTKYGNFTDIEVTILDYGLSRMRLETLDATKRGTGVIYTKLEESIFEGNSAESRQYAIYRYMRSAMMFDNPLTDYESRVHEAKKSRTWRGFYPLTTVIWLCFLVEKLEKHIKWPSESIENEQHNMKNVKILAIEEKQLARTKILLLEQRLKELFGMLKIENIPGNGFYSAASIVDFAEREGWITKLVSLYDASNGSSGYSHVYSENSC